jgi:hypothetical protein
MQIVAETLPLCTDFCKLMMASGVELDDFFEL